MGKDWISRSSTLYSESSSLGVDGKGSLDSASATAFCFDGTDLMLLVKGESIIVQRCRRIAASEGMVVL